MQTNPMKYKNVINLVTSYKEGKERREELLSDILKNGTPLPRPVVYEDIDDEIRKWVNEKLYISYEGKELPTMTLFSNQRFSEYSQTWSYTDSDNNILMNFKTISRENNPQQGKNQGGLWNIPGDRFYLMSRQKVLDDNGTESYLDYKMKQPFCIDLMYNISIFTNKYQLINEFNTKINDIFKARQAYIRPNEHYMPMTLESINDESEYSINDRQFFTQSFIIKVMAYIITENDFKVEEIPARTIISFGGAMDKKKAIAEIYEGDDEIEENNNGEQYYYKPIILTIDYPLCSDTCKFTIDTDVNINNIDYDNIYKNIRIFINDDEVFTKNLLLKNGDEIKIKIKRYYINKVSKLTLYGYNPKVVYDIEKDLPEVEMDFKQPEGIYDIIASEKNKPKIS